METDWLICPFYHWVLDDERPSFERQLRYFRNMGEFIALDDALALVRGGNRFRGRYFCITFDDGFENCYTNAAPILADCNVPATFFVATKYIGLRAETDWAGLAPFYSRSWQRYRRRFDFLSWDQCRELSRSGFTVGSHTHSHIRLSRHSDEDVEAELRKSKQVLESELGVPCKHFACPFGRSGVDFDPSVHPGIASRVGYDCFLTVDEGPNLLGCDPMNLRRNALTPSFTGLLLRYHLWLTR